MKSIEITDAQKSALRAFAKLAKKNPAPSLEEWSSAMGLEYTTIRQHRVALAEAGLVEYDKGGRVRSTRLTKKGERYLAT